MAEDKQDEIKTYYYNDNVIKQGQIFGINTRNWIEGIVFSLFVDAIIININFTPLVKLVACGVLSVAIVFGCCNGIKNRSVIEVLIDEIKFLTNRRKLHLMGPEYEKRHKDFSKMGEGQNNAERLWKKTKSGITETFDKWEHQGEE